MKAKQSTLLLLIALTMTLWTACDRSTPKPQQKTTITVSPTKVSLHVGETQQLSVQISPQESQLKPVFQSQSPAIATVSEEGLVTGVAAGETTIRVQVGDTTALVPVQVEEAPIQVAQEMPMLKFAIPRNDSEQIEDQEVIAYEAKLGRTQQEVDYRPSGFLGKGLTTIPAVVYGIPVDGDADLILAYGMESVANCERTRAMLNQLGFSHIEKAKVSNYLGDEFMGLRAIHDSNPNITVALMDMPNEKLGTTMFIEFAKRQPENTIIDTKHAILPNVQDFPSLEKLVTKNASQINAFEEGLGLRTFRSGESPLPTHLFYRTTESKVQETNLEFVFYIAPTKVGSLGFIITELLCVSSERDLRSKALQDYLKANGFDQNYKISGDAILTVNNKEGALCRISLVRLGQDKYVYQMFLFPPTR
ncbi:Ig-like domain-containing protein [Porphyromonas endodontalis]|uniref:Ig-like domain-containing protein n=1 Tax=Porphyromonas endodontalis TaxID=28124 RepID=UPI0023EF6343|nr:Ig-like domain-containing protein [Porphyromonas endodontalis]